MVNTPGVSSNYVCTVIYVEEVIYGGSTSVLRNSPYCTVLYVVLISSVLRTVINCLFVTKIQIGVVPVQLTNAATFI